MRHAFDVQCELGRLFHEKIYHREIAFRIPDARCEVAVDVRFGDFCKTYYLDLLVGGGAIFELKAVEALAQQLPMKQTANSVRASSCECACVRRKDGRDAGDRGHRC